MYVTYFECVCVRVQNLSAYNTRLFKKESGGKPCYEVRLASAEQKGPVLGGVSVVLMVHVQCNQTGSIKGALLYHQV